MVIGIGSVVEDAVARRTMVESIVLGYTVSIGSYCQKEFAICVVAVSLTYKLI